MSLFWEGLGIGIGLSVLTGPLLFLILEASILKGYRGGFSVTFGIWLSDLTISLLSIYFAKSIIDVIHTESFRNNISWAGGIALIVLGLAAFFSRKSTSSESKIQHSKTDIGYFIKGFVVNSLNPFPFVFWFGISSTYLSKELFEFSSIFFLIGGILIAIIATDTLKVVFAKKISKYIKANNDQIQRFVGGVLVIFGIALLLKPIFFSQL